jgi:hypothetical protein
MGVFEIVFHFTPRLAWTMIFLFVLPQVAEITGTHHCAQTLIEMGSPELFARVGLEH